MTSQFEADLQAPDLPVLTDLSHSDAPMLIAFGGIAGALGVPPFEFFNVTKDLPINRVYLRDLGQCWYHSGIPGVSTNIGGTAAYLRRLIDESRTSAVVTFGNSMGGYAAILFGALIGADAVHAFSPHTCLNYTRLVRNRRQLRHVHRHFPHEYFDLKATITTYGGCRSIHVYYSSRDVRDSVHAWRLRRVRNVSLHSCGEVGHGLVRTLRDSGELRNIVTSAIDSVATNARQP